MLLFFIKFKYSIQFISMQILLWQVQDCAASSASCSILADSQVEIDSLAIFPRLNFSGTWIHKDKHFWKSSDYDFESRYICEHKGNESHNSLPHLQVYLLPYSHNDPGWIQTYEGYFHSYTKKILTNAVAKLSVYKNMTFAWSEVSFLSKWWDGATSNHKHMLKTLINEGRFEILTGGWVMSDEATTTLFGIVNQLIEGHQWLKNKLNITPTSAWAIDPFGHSSTMPYVLKQSGISGMLIQRIHYGWKHWFAEHRSGDFRWRPRWSSNPNDSILCHNAHYDLYPTKHSCGPSPKVCMEYDFRKIEGRREEHWPYTKQVASYNLGDLSNTLMDQYRRTASLTRHNLVFTSLGGDFRFEDPLEFDQQFGNYTRLFDYLNSHKEEYNASVGFGTLTKYFEAVLRSNISLPIFSGDFLPYSDVLFAFAPAYWTGYYGTRPFWKKMCRETEDELMKAEIIFTFSFNLMKQRNYSTHNFIKNYDNLVYARRSVALFQHHDGITGTSPRTTMLDYAKKLHKAWTFSKQIQRLGIEAMWRNELNINVPPLMDETSQILCWKRSHLMRILVETPDVVVEDPNGELITSQINDHITATQMSQNTEEKIYELLFIAELPPLSVVTYEVRRPKNGEMPSLIAEMSCITCTSTTSVNARPTGIFLSNKKIAVEFAADSGLLRRLSLEQRNRGTNNASLSLGRYNSDIGSGAYLLNPHVYTHSILGRNEAKVYLIQGPIASEVVMKSKQLILKSWIVHADSSEINSVVFMSAEVNGSTESQGEFFMRFQTDLNNTEFSRTETPPSLLPVFFTDTNGLAVEKRITLPNLKYQGNHYPMPNYAYIQDETQSQRFSVLVDRTHGVSSVERGSLELIFDRRLMFDDLRGMNEGVQDSENTMSNYAIHLEALPNNLFIRTGQSEFKTWEPSLATQRISKYLNHPPTVYVYDALEDDDNGMMSLFDNAFPEDTFLLTFRTISDHTGRVKSAPSSTALMIVQRLGHLTHDEECNETEQAQWYHNSLNLNATLQVKHTYRTASLVGTTAQTQINNDSVYNDTRHMSIGNLYELHAYLVNM